MESKAIEIQKGSVCLPGFLNAPDGLQGWVIFAHGSGSSRHSSRNQAVAKALNQAGLGTLLFDLLMEEEGKDRQNVFDIALLAERLVLATHWLREEIQPKWGSQPLGFFGASTGAGASIQASAQLNDSISAIVSRGGRVDMAKAEFSKTHTPTLLLVGEHDEPVLTLNREADEKLKNSELFVVSGASHLFEEAGALEQVADKATEWFLKHLS